MPDTDGVFPDDVPIADAVEQQRTTAASAAGEEGSSWEDSQVPLEASASDWQEQREAVLFDPDLEEFDGDR